jgi:lipopolysaccharide export system permease protein
MPIYQRHIILSIARPIIGIILTVTSVVWLSQIIKLIYLFDKGIRLRDFCHLAVLVLPSLFFAILPFGVVVGVVVGYNNLSHDRELIALSNSGLGPYNIIKPALIVAFTTTIIAYSISLYLLPISYSKLKLTLNNFRENYVSNLIQEKVFTQISKNITLYVSEKEESGLLHGVILFEKQQNNTTSILFAKFGRIYIKAHEPYYELRNGIRQIMNEKGNISKMSFDQLLVSLSQPQVCDRSSQKEGCAAPVDPVNKNLQEYFIDELFGYEHDLSDVKKNKLKAEGHQRIIWPLYNSILTLLALAVFVQKPYSRRGNATILTKATATVATVLGVHFLLYHAASKVEIINLALYVNIVLCLVASYYLLNRAGGRI